MISPKLTKSARRLLQTQMYLLTKNVCNIMQNLMNIAGLASVQLHKVVGGMLTDVMIPISLE